MTASFLLQLPFTLLSPLVLFASPMAAGQDSPLPAGAGKQAVEKVCSGCHGMDTVIMARRTKVGWDETVSEMAARGATGFDQRVPMRNCRLWSSILRSSSERLT
jgi:mono/diheme cytochrome c family protein